MCIYVELSFPIWNGALLLKKQPFWSSYWYPNREVNFGPAHAINPYHVLTSSSILISPDADPGKCLGFELRPVLSEWYISTRISIFIWILFFFHSFPRMGAGLVHCCVQFHSFYTEQWLATWIWIKMWLTILLWQISIISCHANPWNHLFTVLHQKKAYTHSGTSCSKCIHHIWADNQYF